MVIALLLMLFMPAIQQDAPKESKPSKPPKRGDIVVAKGCVRRGALESADLADASGGHRLTEVITFRLTGDKKALQELKKEHDGHSDAITGELRTDLPASTGGYGTKVGNTRITIGGANRGMNGEPSPPPMPVLKVKSFEHTGVTCR